MKKTFFAIVALAALVSCDNTVLLEQSVAKAIAFDAPFVEKSTKATDLTVGEGGTLTDFSVYGFVQEIGGVVFNDETVSKNGSGWTYDNTQYWVSEKPYYFTAIAPASQGEFYTPTAVDAGTISFDNTSADTDLIHAYSNVAALVSPIVVQPDPVAFTFNHLLSRVKFSFENGMVAANAKLTISDVAVTDAYKDGVASISNGVLASWVPSGTNSVAFTGIAEDILTNTEGETEHLFFIPESEEFKKVHNLTFKVVLTQGTLTVAEKVHNVALPAVELMPGYSYDFKAVLNDDNVVEDLMPITFTAEIEPWGDFAVTD